MVSLTLRSKCVEGTPSYFALCGRVSESRNAVFIVERRVGLDPRLRENQLDAVRAVGRAPFANAEEERRVTDGFVIAAPSTPSSSSTFAAFVFVCVKAQGIVHDERGEFAIG